MADVLDRLEQEHRQLEHLLERLEEADDDDRPALLARVERMLGTHMETEERVVYPVLSDLDEEMAEEAEKEHTGARELMAKLREEVSEPGFGALVAALAGAIGHHVEEEEEEAFPKLRKEAGRERLAAMDAAAPPTPSDDALPDTKEELYARAQELDIPGRSSMDADELREAVRAAS